MSVRAFSAQAIEDKDIRTPGDLIALMPNLSLVEAQSVGTSFMTIRGITQVRNGDAPMAVVVDGVEQSDARQFTQDLFDIQSIEVLRGPQGALYGRNAVGGAILITTRQPTDETTGFIDLGYGTGKEKIAQGAVSGALVKDQLFYRLAGSITDRAGYFENLYLGRKADPYRDKTFRGLLKWDVSDKLSIDLRANYVHDRASASNYIYQPTHLLANCQADPNNLFDFTLLNADHVSRTYCSNNPSRNTRQLSEITLKARYDLDFAALTAVASHNHINETVAADQFPYTASRNLSGLDGTQTQYVNINTNSLEARLTSPTQPGLRWSAGGSVLKTARFISTTTGSDLGLGIEDLTDAPDFTSPTNPTTSWFADHNHNLASALFGNVDYDLGKQVEISFALRHDRDHRQQIVDSRQSAGLPTGCSAANVAGCTNEATYSAWQPKVSLRYKAADGSLLYASYGEGFRSGQFNQSGVGAAAAAASPPVNGVADEIGAEIVRSVELGYKTTLADGKVTLNGSLYHTQDNNAPYFVFIGAVGAQVLVPINRVNISGGEIEAATELAKDWTANLGFGVTRSKIAAYVIDPADVGKNAPYTPNMTANLGMQYRFEAGQGMRILLGGDLIFKGRQFWDPENSTARSALTLIDLHGSLESADRKWIGTLAIKNVADKVYNAEWVGGGFAQPAPPRVIRVDVRYRF